MTDPGVRGHERPMLTSRLSLLGAALVVAGGACSARSSDSTTTDPYKEVAIVPVTINRDLDLLFVVDNSNSMTDKQVALAAAFPAMMDVLGELDGGIPNLHIGVISTDMGTATTMAPGLTETPGCHGDGDHGNLLLGQAGGLLVGTFLSDVADSAGGRTVNYTGALRDAFGAMARLGDQGCGFEAPLLALRSALAANAVNVGFLRPDANLAVVFVTDEDDCSASTAALFGPDSAAVGLRQSFRCTRFGLTCDQALDTPGVKTNCVPATASPMIADVQPFIDELVATKADPSMIMVAAIAGNPAPVAVELRAPPGSTELVTALAHSCSYTASLGEAVADPAVRLQAFLDGFPGRSTFQTICDGDLTSALLGIGDSAKQLVGDPCVETAGLADADAARDGIQPTCEVVDTLADAAGTTTPLPACTPADHANCYELAADLARCPRQRDHLRLTTQRSSAPLPGTRTHVRCLKA